MDNTIYKLFPLLVLPCLNDLVLLIEHITICTRRAHTSIRTDTVTRLPILIIRLFYSNGLVVDITDQLKLSKMLIQ